MKKNLQMDLIVLRECQLFRFLQCLTNVKLNNIFEEEPRMDIEKRLALLQNTYVASIAETVNTYDKLKVLDSIVEKRKD